MLYELSRRFWAIGYSNNHGPHFVRPAEKHEKKKNQTSKIFTSESSFSSDLGSPHCFMMPKKIICSSFNVISFPGNQMSFFTVDNSDKRIDHEKETLQKAVQRS